MQTSKYEAYRRSFALTTIAFLAVWAVVAIGLHLPARSFYTSFGRVNGAPLNWWFVQLSILLGIVLAFAYAYTVNRLEEKYEVGG